MTAHALLAADPSPIRLWPGIAPGERGDIGAEIDKTTAKDPLIAGRPIIHLTNVSVPTMTVYRPPADRDTGAAVVVFPGGGYYIIVTDLEGTEVCPWLNSIGVTAILLKYRVPRREGRAPYEAPLQDAQRAVGLVRDHAGEWGIDGGRIGTLGFSAGGHLSATLSAHCSARTYPRVDAADDVSCRPDFQILVYPAYLRKETESVGDGTETAVDGNTPPSFIVMAEDDPHFVENALGYGRDLAAAKVPVELHIYPAGGHGYGLRPTADFVTTWPQRAADWMRSRRLLDRK